MSIWSAIGKGLGIAGAVVGAPFTGGGTLAAIPGIIGKVAGPASQAIGAATQSAANNRGEQLDASILQQQLRDNEARDYNDANLARSVEGRASGNDALKNVLRTQYIQNRQGYTPKNGLPSYGFGPTASTDVEKQGAAAYGNEAMGRLEGGNPLPAPHQANFTLDPNLTHQSMWEKVGNVAAPALSIWDLINKIQKPAATP